VSSCFEGYDDLTEVPEYWHSLDDTYLQRLFASTPPNCIVLLEDIDCAFPPREGEEDETDALAGKPFDPYTVGRPKSDVTLSGLLNVLDSVSSEEGRIVFATVSNKLLFQGRTVCIYAIPFRQTILIVLILRY
jgi:hypothetical protein